MTRADTEARGHQEVLPGTDPRQGQGDHSAQEDDGALDPHQGVHVQAVVDVSGLVEDGEGVSEDGVIAWGLEEEHEGEAGEEGLVDPRVDVLPPGLCQGCVEHIHVCLDFFEELHRVILPPEPGQGSLCRLELGFGGEVERGLGDEPDRDDEEDAQTDPGETQHPPVDEGAEDVSVEDAGLGEQGRHHAQHPPEVQGGHLH